MKKRIFSAFLAVSIMVGLFLPIQTRAEDVSSDTTTSITEDNVISEESTAETTPPQSSSGENSEETSSIEEIPEELNPFDFGILPFGLTPGDSTMSIVQWGGRGYSFPNDPANYGGFAGVTATNFTNLRLAQGGEISLAYCVEFGIPTSTGATYDSVDTYNALTYEQQRLISLILSYGYHYDADIASGTVDQDWYVATQVAIWLVEKNEWNSPLQNNILNVFFANNPGSLPHFNNIQNTIDTFKIIPSFATDFPPTAPTYTLLPEGANFVVRLNDTNGVLANFDFAMPFVHFVKNGNELTAVVPQADIGKIGTTPTSTATKTVPVSLAKIATYWVHRGGGQNVITAEDGMPDPINAYFKLRADSSTIQIVKTSEDGVKAGFQFKVLSGSGTYNQVHTTDSNGIITIPNLPPEMYRVSEVNTPNKYVQPNDIVLDVTAGATTTFNFNNVLKKSNLRIVKTSEDGIVSGLQFRVTGNGVNQTVTTASDGSITIPNLVIGTYTVTEINTPSRYIQPASQNVTVTYNSTATVNFNNVLKKGNVQFRKSDNETNQIIANKGSFTVNQWDNTTNRYIAYSTMTYDNATNMYVLKNLPITIKNDGKYQVVETTAPSGYVRPSTTTYNFTITTNGQTVNINSGTILNTPQKGKIRITKTDTETSKTLANTVFEIVANQNIVVNGQTKYTKGTIVDTLTTNTNGLTTSKDLYLGQYLVREKTSSNGYVHSSKEEIITLSYQSQTVDVFIVDTAFTNMPQKANLRITKTDEETAQALANAEYTIKAREDIIVNGDVKHSKDDVIEVITTGDDGVAISALLYLGEYTVEETTAPFGYVVDSTVYDFTLEYKEQTIDVYVYDLEFTNMPQKAITKLTKKGLGLTGFEEYETEFGTAHNPIYDMYNLDGAIFNIYADEDIIINGDLKHSKDELVDTITSSKDNPVLSKELYLGRYRITEIVAPEGYYIENDTFYIELTYQDQDIPTFEYEMTTFNDPQTATVSFDKTMQLNEYFPNDFAFNDVRFGIFVKSDIKNLNGEVVLTKDKMVDVICVDEDGKGISNTNIPFGEYYLQEIQTSEGWVLNQTKFNFAFFPLDQDVPHEDIIPSEKEILNETVKGTVSFTKRSEFTDESLEGAVYGIYTDSTQEIYTLQAPVVKAFNGFKAMSKDDEFITKDDENNPNDKLVEVLTTDENGEATSKKLPYGAYYLKEIAPPEHHHLDTRTKYHFFIGREDEFSTDEDLIEIIVKNPPIIGSISATYSENGYKDYYTSYNNTSPKTYDDSNVWVYVIIASVCLAILIYLKLARSHFLAFSVSGGSMSPEKKIKIKAERKLQMKRIILMTIVFTMVIFLCSSCGSENNTSPTRTTADKVVETKELEFLNDTDFKAEFEEEITQNNKKYLLQGVEYTTLSTDKLDEVKQIEHIVVQENLYSQNAEFEENIVINNNGVNLNLKLNDVAYEQMTITERKETVIAFTDYDLKTITPIPDPTKTIIYYDNKTNGDLTVTLPFKTLETLLDFHWLDDVIVPITFNIYNAEYYMLGDKLVSYNHDSPALYGYEEDVLNLVGLNSESYRINSFTWVGDDYAVGENLQRNAVAYGERYVANYRGVYEGTINLPNANGYKAVATYIGEDTVLTGDIKYTVKAVATYIRDMSYVITIISISLIGLFLAVFIIGIIFIIKKKRRTADETKKDTFKQNTRGTKTKRPI